MTSFPDIPVDIAREILEFVACIAGPSRFTVSLVSRTVQQWTDPYVLDRIIINNDDKWNEFSIMLPEKSFTPRMKQAFLFLRIFVVMPHIGRKSLPITMEELVQFFPRLEIIYISPTGSHSLHRPRPTIHRIGAAFGAMWLRGIQNPDDLRHWNITHLDLVPMHPEEWSDLVRLGLPRLNTLTHMCCDLEGPSSINEIRTHLKTLVTTLPSSLLLCLVNIDFENTKFAELPDRYDVGLDDRILICNSKDYSNEKNGRWILRAELFNDFDQWTGAVIETETYWSRGLNMVNLRRAESL
ncbi:hypothetical protein DL96DRAFT_1678440 [Flagelloscypha sp. PMI_526]|nr:hypothetical protein DL96DRAFT_1678440 [Flagelloscypha sp. PMI_526]